LSKQLIAPVLEMGFRKEVAGCVRTRRRGGKSRSGAGAREPPSIGDDAAEEKA